MSSYALFCYQTVGVAQRINGKVSGVLNGYTIREQDLHSYIVTEEGRTFTAVSRIPPQLGFSMQSLYLITDILGWLFAVPQSTLAKNGYMLTGAVALHFLLLQACRIAARLII